MGRSGWALLQLREEEGKAGLPGNDLRRQLFNGRAHGGLGRGPSQTHCLSTGRLKVFSPSILDGFI